MKIPSLSKRKFIYLVILVLIYVFAPNSPLGNTITPLKPQPTPISQTSLTALTKVLYVVDGDTIDLSINGKKESVRFIGIDTPETKDPRKTVQCFGKEASNRTKELLSGKSVRLERDPTQQDRDKYFRLLRYVYLDDVLINKLLIEEGFAHEYTYQSNPYKFQSEFIAAERLAREQKRGLWSDSACLSPTP